MPSLVGSERCIRERGRPRPGHQRPRARETYRRGLTRGPDAVSARPISLPSYPVATGRPRPGHQRPRARETYRRGLTRGPDAVLARPLSLPSYPVATGRPLPGHQRPRARETYRRGLTRPARLVPAPGCAPRLTVTSRDSECRRALPSKTESVLT